MSKDDTQLICDYLGGDDQALESLIDRYLTPIYSFIYRLVGNTDEAQDLTQEVFVKVWKKLDSYDQQQNFKTWLFTIARNTTIDWFRKRKAIAFSRLETEDNKSDFSESIIDLEPLPDELAERRETKEWLEKILAEIPFDYQAVVILHNNDHMTFEEIAAVMDKPMNTVKSQYRRALVMLRQKLDHAPK